jgi:hypothetical protein
MQSYTALYNFIKSSSFADGSSHVSISMDKTQFGMIGFSQMIDGGCFVRMNAALTVNFVVKGIM